MKKNELKSTFYTFADYADVRNNILHISDRVVMVTNTLCHKQMLTYNNSQILDDINCPECIRIYNKMINK